MLPNQDQATGVRAMLLRLENIKAGQRKAELDLSRKGLPRDHLKSKYERKKQDTK